MENANKTAPWEKTHLSMAQVTELAKVASRSIRPDSKVYAIPRGGIMAAMAIRQFVPFEYVDVPTKADYIVDDLIDSGDTMARYLDACHKEATSGRRFHREPAIPVVLVNKTILPPDHPLGKWLVFPWEGGEVGSLEDNVKRMLQFIGEDAERGGLLETPARVAKAWAHWAGGYKLDPQEVLKVFEDGAEKVDEMVLVRNIPFYSHCEHHMAPFFGHATVGYVPNGKIVGLSKLSRLVDVFARRLQVQERLTTQIADALNEGLKPKGVGVIITARHLCMESRGVRQQGHDTTTSALRGVMLDGSPRQEFLLLAK